MTRDQRHVDAQMFALSQARQKSLRWRSSRFLIQKENKKTLLIADESSSLERGLYLRSRVAKNGENK